jgi:hypothetical protein
MIASAYVAAQAHALCLVQSKAYPTQAAVAAAYKKAFASSTLSARDLAEARAFAVKNVALRKRVSDKVAALCG